MKLCNIKTQMQVLKLVCGQNSIGYVLWNNIEDMFRKQTNYIQEFNECKIWSEVLDQARIQVGIGILRQINKELRTILNTISAPSHSRCCAI